MLYYLKINFLYVKNYIKFGLTFRSAISRSFVNLFTLFGRPVASKNISSSPVSSKLLKNVRKISQAGEGGGCRQEEGWKAKIL